MESELLPYPKSLLEAVVMGVDDDIDATGHGFAFFLWKGLRQVAVKAAREPHDGQSSGIPLGRHQGRHGQGTGQGNIPVGDLALTGEGGVGVADDFDTVPDVFKRSG